MQTPYFSLPSLPWDRFAEEENRFRLIIGVTLLIFVVMSFLIATFELPQKVRQQAEVVPPRVAKLVTEKRLPPPPPPPPPKVEEKKPELKPEPEKKVEKKPEPEKPKPEKKPEPPKPKPQEKPKVTIKTQEQLQTERKQEAKQEAVKAAAVFDSLADLREQTADLSTTLNTQQQALSASNVDGPAAATQRNLIGKAATGGSGGVQVAKASTGGGGAGTVGGTGRLGKTATTNIAAVASTSAKVADPVKQNSAGTGASGKARRTTEQIQVVFDRYKGQINQIYRRALREDPSLEGTLLLRLEIQPNGSVTACSVVSSELSNPDLERKIVVKVKSLNFGAGNVEVWKGNFPIKFFPS